MHKQHTTPLASIYARSMLELADEKGQTDEVGQELADLAKVVEAEPMFATFLAHPAIGEAERQRVIEKAFRGRVSPLVFNFLGVMSRNGRLSLLRQVANAYADLLDQQKGIIEVDVFVAQKLSAEQLDQV